MKFPSALRRISVEDERSFERSNVQSKRERYLNTNPLDRMETDPAYARKVNYLGVELKHLRGPILDIGANTAGEATVLCQAQYEYVVTDINEAALAISRERVRHFGLREPHYVAADANELPFLESTFAAATFVESLHHMVDYQVALDEAFRVLAPGGTLVAYEPNGLDVLRRVSEVKDRFRGTIEKSFFRTQLVSLLMRAGFQHIRVTPMMTGKSTWKAEEVPRYRRPISGLHGRLSEVSPSFFGNLLVTAVKGPVDGRVEVSSFDHARFQSPVSRGPLRFAPDRNGWLDEKAKLLFPDADGIPILIAADAVPL